MFLEPNVLNQSERSDVREAHRLLDAGARTLIAGDGTHVQLPDSVCTLLKEIIRELDSGNEVSMVPVGADLTMGQAAELLGIDRTQVTGLVETGELPVHEFGQHPRISLVDLLKHRRNRDAKRKAALDQISKDAFEAGLYDRADAPRNEEDV